MFAWVATLMVLYLTTGTSNLAMALPTATNLQPQQNDKAESGVSSQSREESEEEGDDENTGGSPFSQENLQAMGQQVGEEMIQEVKDTTKEQVQNVSKEVYQEIKATTKEETTHAMHKVQDKVDRQTDKWVEDMQNKGSTRELPSSSSDDDQVFRELQNIIAVNSKRFMSDVVRSFLSPEDIRESLERAPVTHSTSVDETLELPNAPATKIVTPYTRPTRSVDDAEAYDVMADDSRTSDIEGKAASPFPYIPSYPSTGGGSTSTSSPSSNSNPLYGGGYTPPGMSGSGPGEATLIIGGFNILLVPMPGVTANNMGSALQNGQQLGQLAPGNPFAGSRAAI